MFENAQFAKLETGTPDLIENVKALANQGHTHILLSETSEPLPFNAGSMSDVDLQKLEMNGKKVFKISGNEANIAKELMGLHKNNLREVSLTRDVVANIEKRIPQISSADYGLLRVQISSLNGLVYTPETLLSELQMFISNNCFNSQRPGDITKDTEEVLPVLVEEIFKNDPKFVQTTLDVFKSAHLS